MNWRGIFAITLKDIKSTLRDKHTLFWLVVFPMMMIAFSAFLWATPRSPETLKVGVVYQDSGIQEYAFNATTIVYVMKEVQIDNQSIFDIKEYDNLEDVLKDVRQGQLDAAIVFPEGFSKNLTLGLPAHMKIYICASDAYRVQITKSILNAFFREFSEEITNARIEYVPEEYQDYARGLATPIQTNVEEVVPEAIATRRGLLGWFTIGMVGIEFLFGGLTSGALAIVSEREKGTLRRLIAAPINSWDLLLGKTLSSLFELAISTVTCILFGLALGAKITWRLTDPAYWMIILLFVLGGIMMIGMGLIISLVGKTSKGASGIAMVIAYPLMFLTGLWLPKWILPKTVRIIADYFPLTWAIDAARDIMIYEKGISSALSVLPWLTLTTIVIYLVGALAFKYSMKQIA